MSRWSAPGRHTADAGDAWSGEVRHQHNTEEPCEQSPSGVAEQGEGRTVTKGNMAPHHTHRTQSRARVPGVASYTASGSATSIPAADSPMPSSDRGLPVRGVLGAQAGRGPRGGRGDVGRVWAGPGATASGLA